MRTPTAMICVGVLLATSGCALRPQLVKHHKSTTTAEEHNRLSVHGGGDTPLEPVALLGGNYLVTGFTTLVPPSAASAPFISKLSDRGQAQLIERVGASATKADELANALLKLGEKPVKACTEGPLRFERRLVLSLAGRHKAQASRFDSMAYVLTLSDADKDRSRFITWNRFDTLHETVALGTTRMKQSQSAGWTDFDSEKATAAATAAAPAKELLSTLNLTASQSRELEETIASARRFTPITGTLSGRGASLVQQGAVGLDLFGNMTADFTIEMGPGTDKDPATKTEWLYSATGLVADGKAQPKVADTTVARCARDYAWSIEPIKATLGAAGMLRRVSEGEETVIEGDDTAVYTTLVAPSKATIELVDTASLRVVSFTIQRAKQNYNLRNHTENDDIRFATLEEARSWVRWLRETGNTELKGTQLGWGGPPDGTGRKPLLKKSELASLEIRRCESATRSEPTCGPIAK